LFNRLVSRDRAIVTDVPGTTRDTLSETIDLNGVPVLLTDTAGLRETTDTIESLGIERTQQAMSDADLVLEVIDASSGTSTKGDEREGISSIRIMNKCDLGVAECFSGERAAIRVSALTGEGIDSLRAAILGFLNRSDVNHEGLLVTNARHYDLLKSAGDELDGAISSLSEGRSEELVLVSLHNALKYLGQITGETTSEDILSQVFSTFCIGK
jgi:tRNA modification GTPase